MTATLTDAAAEIAALLDTNRTIAPNRWGGFDLDDAQIFRVVPDDGDWLLHILASGKCLGTIRFSGYFASPRTVAHAIISASVPGVVREVA